MGVPFSGGHAGKILFGTADVYLYLNDCGWFTWTPCKKSLLGKILRIDLDHIPSMSIYTGL